MMAMTARQQRINMGKGYGNSATSGANIVKPRAKNWQIPIAVALFSAGKSV